jgi:hypothetical protein
VTPASVFEFFGEGPMDFEDMDDVVSSYSGGTALFPVLLDGEQVVGAGAIRLLQPEWASSAGCGF